MRLLGRLASNRRAPQDSLRLEPGILLRLAGLASDPWQLQVLGSPAARMILLCSRQVGKSTTAAALALLTAILEAPALVLVVSPSERQSGELLRKVRDFYAALQRPRRTAGPVLPWAQVHGEGAALEAAWQSLPAKERESALQLHLRNGSRIIGLPGKLATILGYSGVSLLIIDEAARVPDDLYYGVRPMLATSKGRLLALSTPCGKRGWFHDSWDKGEGWQRHSVSAAQCPRIPPEFLRQERGALGPRWFRQEYCLSFEAATGSLFSEEAMDHMFAYAGHSVPLFGAAGADDDEDQGGAEGLPLFGGGEF